MVEEIANSETVDAALQSCAIQGAHYAYPWKALEKKLQDGTMDGFWVIAYGSLLNRDSARRTLPKVASLSPVWGIGGTRIFNYCMGEEYFQSPLHFQKAGLHRTVLTVKTDFSPQSVFNGLRLWVSAKDFPAFRRRERNYNLVEIPFIPWEKKVYEGDTALVLDSQSAMGYGAEVGNPKLLPVSEYLEICLQGAFATSKAFGEAFLNTTWLANERTRLRDYINPERRFGADSDQ